MRAEQPSSAFVGRRSPDLDLIFALQLERTANQDNTVSIQNHRLQIAAVRWRGTLAGCSVTVHQHLDRTFSLTHGPHRLGRYDAHGAASCGAPNPAASRSLTTATRAPSGPPLL